MPSSLYSIHLADVKRGQFTFKWSRNNIIVCPTDYIIISNCGLCPALTSSTSATCYVAHQRSQPDVCTFAIKIQICGHMIYTNTSLNLTIISIGELDVNTAKRHYCYNNKSLSRWSHCTCAFILKLVPDPPELKSSPHYQLGNLVNIHTTIKENYMVSLRSIPL